MAAETTATVHVRLVVDNLRALDALKAAIANLEQCEDLTWRPEIKRAAKALRYALKHLRTRCE